MDDYQAIRDGLDGITRYQREYNMRKAKMMDKPTEITMRDLEKVYEQAVCCWDDYYACMVEDIGGVNLDLMGPADGICLSEGLIPGGTMTFKRYPALLSSTDLPSIEQYYDANLLSVPMPRLIYNEFCGSSAFNMHDYLVDACLKKDDVAGYRFAKAQAIVDESWVINLRDVTREEDMKQETYMEPFLQGVRDEVKRAWEQSHVDVSTELTALKKIYEDALNKSAYQEQSALEHLDRAMKTYLKVKEEREALKKKLMSLESKIGKDEQPEDDEGDDD